jgi:hypothetical protein
MQWINYLSAVFRFMLSIWLEEGVTGENQVVSTKMSLS